MMAPRAALLLLVAILPELSAQTRQFNVKDYGAKSDCRFVDDAAIDASSNLLRSETAAFTSADVGLPIYVLGAGPVMRGRADPLNTTISSVQDPTTAVLANSASTSASNVHAAWGTDNRAAFQKAIDAASTAGGGTVYVPAGTYRIARAFKIVASNIHLMGDGESSHIHESSVYTSAEGPLINQEDGTPVLVVGVNGAPTANLEIDHLKLTNSGTEIHNSINGAGIIAIIDGSIENNFKLHDLRVETSSRVGLGSAAVTNGYEIYNNYIVGGLHGMYVTGPGSNGYIHDNHLVNSVPLRRQYNSIGIAIKSQTNLRVISNTVEGYGWGITLTEIFSKHVLVENNIVTSDSDTGNVLGIAGNLGNDISVVNNQIECRRSGIGIWFYSNRVNDINIVGNSISGCPHGITTDSTATPRAGPSGLTIKNNTITRCAEAIRVQDAGGINIVQGNNQSGCSGRYLWVVTGSQSGSSTYFADDNTSDQRSDSPTFVFDKSVRRVPKSEIPQE